MRKTQVCVGGESHSGNSRNQRKLQLYIGWHYPIRFWLGLTCKGQHGGDLVFVSSTKYRFMGHLVFKKWNSVSGEEHPPYRNHLWNESYLQGYKVDPKAEAPRQIGNIERNKYKPRSFLDGASQGNPEACGITGLNCDHWQHSLELHWKKHHYSLSVSWFKTGDQVSWGAL